MYRAHIALSFFHMSGHSKWAQIKRQKGAKDVKRGLAFTKLGNAITIAVKQGGNVGDPNQNFRLRLAVDAARAQNMPKENIQRAIDRAVSKGSESFEETVYEGFGPHGVAIIVEAATDNKNRTTPEVKSVFDKNGGSMGNPGAVSYMFKQTGRIIVAKDGKTMDDVFLAAADAGAEDVEEVDDEVFVYADSGNISKLRDALQTQGFTITETEVIKKPITLTELDEASAEKVIGLLDKLEELDDVQKVYSNLEIKE